MYSRRRSIFLKTVFALMVFVLAIGFTLQTIGPNVPIFQEFFEPANANLDIIEENREKLRSGKLSDAERVEAYARTAAAYSALTAPEQDTPDVVPPDAEANLQKAIDAAEEAIAIKVDPKDKDAEEALELQENMRVSLGTWYQYQGDAARGAAMFAQLVKMHPDNEDYLLGWGQAAQSAGDNPTAIAAYKRYIKLVDSPDDPGVKEVQNQIKALEQQQAGGDAATPTITPAG